jgi:hypothetical protein
VPEHWWIAGDTIPPHFEWNWSRGWGKYDDERAVSGEGYAFGEIRVDRSA